MRARAKAAKQFFCGEVRSYTGMGSISLIDANEPIEALFLYVEERAKGYDPLKPGEEVVVLQATTGETFVLMSDDGDEAGTAVEIVEEPQTGQPVEQAGE